MKKLLITGSTGYIGSHYVFDRLMNSDAVIYCIARATHNASAEERVQRALQRACVDAGGEVSDENFCRALEQRVRVVKGDVTQQQLGLEASFVDEVVIDEIWHFAAMLRFTDKLRKHIIKTTQEGTRQIIALAERWPGCELNYISTAYVAGKRSGFIVEGPTDTAFETNNAYEDAKRASEAMVRQAGDEQGLAYRIFRPSMVVANSKTARGNTDTGFYGLLTICGRMKNEIESKIPGYLTKFPVKLLIGNPDAKLNLVYIDDVVDQINRIQAAPTSLNKTFHIVNDSQIPVKDLVCQLGETVGICIETVSDEMQLEPLDHLVRKQVGGFEHYFNTEYQFDRSESSQFFQPARAWYAIDKERLAVLAETYYDEFSRNDARGALHESVVNKMEKVSIAADNGDLTYYRGGHGTESLLVINAYGQSLHFWNDVLGDLLANYRVLVWEIRGTSVSDGGMSSFYTTEDHIRDACAIIEAERLSHCHTIGWCTGPKLSIQLADRYPQVIRSLTFITPAFKGVSGFSGDTRYERNMEPLCKLVDRKPEAAGSLIKSMNAYFADRSDESERFGVSETGAHESIKNVLGMVDRNLRPLLMAPFVSETSILNYSRQLLQFWKHDVIDYVPKIHQPVMLLTGSHDEIASPVLGIEVTRQFRNAIGFQIEGGSHYIHKEQHQIVTSLIRKFLSDGVDMINTDPRVDTTIQSAA
ncbi:alpha/beta fold hydrolase [Pseudomonas sp. J452]|uniref:alpha/beta fold hydrolase n=1 Tax=Pseudomonas sp. J452 TaxID=2898441 RepID=UPI0021AD8527|nr:alpha/beta fold hydrolase [Pseudomonas sp. J452]UUY08382.1 alpha/beta fold hydrolase [Pseudomonas sp. J452]